MKFVLKGYLEEHTGGKKTHVLSETVTKRRKKLFLKVIPGTISQPIKRMVKRLYSRTRPKKKKNTNPEHGK